MKGMRVLITRGRLAGKEGVVEEEVDDIYVIVRVEGKEKKVNRRHLIPLLGD